ncbi:MAG: hypothetical protein RIT15_1284 [Pseudomonadota bacterium]
MVHPTVFWKIALVLGVTTVCTVAQADTGKLLLTGGVSTIEGAAGGGLSPWAVIGSNATDGETGAAVHVTRASTKDYGLNSAGAVIGFNNQYELSIARQAFNTGITGPQLSVPNLVLKQTILGVKARVAGDAVLDSDTWKPQLAVGAQFKSLDSTGLDATLTTLGAKRAGVDLYASATKLFLAQGILVNGTLRATKANQNGLLGFGASLGGANDKYRLMPEFSVAYLLSSRIAIGAEYRAMRNNLQVAGQAAGLGQGLQGDAWRDFFIAWAPSKHVSITAAYVNLGRIVPGTTAGRAQTGTYLSAQIAF